MTRGQLWSSSKLQGGALIRAARFEAESYCYNYDMQGEAAANRTDLSKLSSENIKPAKGGSVVFNLNFSNILDTQPQ